MTLKQAFWTLVGVITLIGLLLVRQGCQHRQDQVINTPVLRSNEKEKIVIDSHHRTITQITHTGTQVLNMPSHTFSVVEDNSGKLSLNVQEWGLEHEFFGGVGHDGNDLRANTGISFFYYHRLDLNFHLTFKVDKKIDSEFVRPLISGSYNVYSNTHLFLGVNPLAPKEIQGGVFWRI